MPIIRPIVVSLAVGVALSSAAPDASAQAPAGGLGGGMRGQGLGQGQGHNAVMVMMAPAVQDELKLSEEQKTKVFEIAREASRKSRELMQAAFRNGGGNTQGLLAEGLRMRRENEKAVMAELKPEQKARAHEIMLRVEGPLAVARPEVADKLNLSDTQTQQIQGVLGQLMLAMRGVGQGQGQGQAGDAASYTDDPAAGRSGAGQMREAAMQQVGRVLTAKQKAAFNAMLGEPFDLSKIDPSLPKSGAAPAGKDDAAKDKASPKRKRGAAGSKKGAVDESTKPKG